MGIKEIEQEIKDIPPELKKLQLELRKLRVAKQDLEAENDKLFNEKINFQEKIIAVKKKQMEETDKLSLVVAQVQKNIEENKKILAQRNKDLAILGEKKSEFEGIKAEIAALIDKNKQVEIANIKKDNALREANKKLQESQVQVSKDKAKNIADEEKNKVRQVELDKKLAEIERLNKILATKNDDIEKTLEEEKVVKEEYEKRLKEIEELKKAATAQIGVYKSAEKSYQDQQIQLEELKEELQEEIRKMKGKSESFDRMNTELNNRENRIELIELKLQKFARDNNVIKELEEMKKSLEPKV